MKFEIYLEQIQNCKNAKDLQEIRNHILYEENDLSKTDMFLLAEFIEFRRHYL